MGCFGSKQKKVKPSDPTISQTQKHRLQNIASNTNIRLVYVFQQVLGSGGFGIVKLAYAKANPQKNLAVKIIQKKRVRNKAYVLLRELQILKLLDHPNIIKFYQVYQDSMFFYICMEYAGGGELLERITQKQVLREKEAAFMLKKLFSAVNHMHQMGIVHRDLKPENILFESYQRDSEPQIVDFGLSNQYHERESLHTIVGTPIYVSPQVLKGTYDTSCDVWSLGIIMYILLCGHPPFFGDTKPEIFKQIEQAKLNFKGAQWHEVSPNAIDLIKQLLQKNPKKRITAQKALDHPWFNQGTLLPRHSTLGLTDNEKPIDPQILKMLQNFKTPNQFQQEVMKVLVNQLNEKEIINLREAFRAIDTDHSGIIQMPELQEVMVKCGFNTTKEEIQKIFLNIKPENGIDGQMRINYTQFITATLDSQVYLTQEKLWSVFQYFDQSNVDFITTQDIVQIMKRHGQTDINQTKVYHMLKDVDPNHDGKITFDQFKTIMMNECDVDYDQINENGIDEQNIDRITIEQSPRNTSGMSKPIGTVGTIGTINFEKSPRNNSNFAKTSIIEKSNSNPPTNQ